MKRKIVILGSTGSIGKQTLEIIQKFPNDFEIVGLSSWENIKLLKEQILLFKPKVAVIKNENFAKNLKKNLNNFNKTKIFWGIRGLIRIATLEEVDIVVIAISGIAALLPTFEAIKGRKKIAIANKEAIVTAGEILLREAKIRNTTILPIDSEHSAIFQCLKNEEKDNIEKIILTASGGALYNLTESALKNVSVEEALNHPTWKMGEKITIDSATLMNKGLEVIEAKWLFDIPVNKVEIVIHPQSYVHSMVQFKDGTTLAQLSDHDMKIPIQFALFYPDRVSNDYSKLDFTKISQLTFKKPNFHKFPCIDLAYQAINSGGTMPAVLNGANEIAVNAFLNHQISLPEIPIIIQNTIKSHVLKLNPSIEDILNADYWARQKALSLCVKK
jgi:1-deoxy-D-xylulose-5-phosphate reductoisomerase